MQARLGASVYLLEAQVYCVPPFGTMRFPFRDDEGAPRMMTVVHGAGGVGKTALLHVLASTRPGHAIVLGAPRAPDLPPPHAACDWLLGEDDPDRPHALTVVTPNVRRPPDDELAALRRREQGLFDRKAREGGFVFLAMSSARWFSRQPVALHAPLRTVASYDVRTTANLDDASRCDLTRDTKQALAYASIASALAPGTHRERNRLHTRRGGRLDTRLLGTAMHEMVDAIARLVGFTYVGLEPTSLEPTFVTRGGRALTFDQLPTRARHLVAFAALPIRTLWAAYPGRDPRIGEAVIAIDEVDLHQDPTVQERLASALRTCLPRVQWILTTTSPVVASSCDARDVLALRRLPDDEHIELFMDEQARTH
jgi:hypothetical protein